MPHQNLTTTGGDFLSESEPQERRAFLRQKRTRKLQKHQNVLTKSDIGKLQSVYIVIFLLTSKLRFSTDCQYERSIEGET